MSSRYFHNRFHNSGRADVNAALYKNRILECIDNILKNFEPSARNGEKGLYTGAAGVAYALYYVVKSNLFPERNKELLKAAESYSNAAFLNDNMRCRKKVGLLSGNSGVYLVAALICARRKDQESCKTYIKEYKKLSKICEPIDFLKDGSDEMFVGRAGYLFGLLKLERELEVEVLSSRSLHCLCEKVIESGKRSRREVEFPGDLPLYYEYHSKPYLGAAHGIAGILQALLSFPDFLACNPDSRDLVRRSVDFLLNLCREEANIATNLNGALDGSGKLLVHWCHGAAGIVYLFARAYLVFERKEKYLNGCRAVADTVWEKGLLKKGPGICHGVAGSGYVFLLMHRLTGEEKYLYRAERFAHFMFTDEFVDGARTPDRPYSLYEGWAGTVCYLTDLLRPYEAHFPFMDVFLT